MRDKIKGPAYVRGPLVKSVHEEVWRSVERAEWRAIVRGVTVRSPIRRMVHGIIYELGGSTLWKGRESDLA
jgi:hypothetical protein